MPITFGKRPESEPIDAAYLTAANTIRKKILPQENPQPTSKRPKQDNPMMELLRTIGVLKAIGVIKQNATIEEALPTVKEIQNTAIKHSNSQFHEALKERERKKILARKRWETRKEVIQEFAQFYGTFLARITAGFAKETAVLAASGVREVTQITLATLGFIVDKVKKPLFVFGSFTIPPAMAITAVTLTSPEIAALLTKYVHPELLIAAPLSGGAIGLLGGILGTLAYLNQHKNESRARERKVKRRPYIYEETQFSSKWP